MILIDLLAKIAKWYDPESSEKIDNLVDKSVPYQTTGKLTKFLKPFIIEPYMIVSKDVNMDNNSRDVILKYCVNVFATFYLQVFRIMTGLQGVNPEIVFKLLQTTGSGGDILRGAKEGITYCEESLTSEINNYFNYIHLGLEDNDSRVYNSIKHTHIQNDKMSLTKRGEINSALDKDEYLSSMFSRIIEVKLIGKIYQETFDGNGKTDTKKEQEQVVSIPVSIMPVINIAPINSIISAFDHSNVEHSFMARLNAWRAKSISTWEFLTASDLGKKYKQKRFKDIESYKVLDQYNKSDFKNVFKLYKGGRGFSSNYNILIITQDELEQLSNLYSYNIIKSPRERQEWMDASHMLMVFALDTATQTGSIYLSDFDRPYIVSIKSLDKGKKEVDFNSAISAIMTGRPPMF